MRGSDHWLTRLIPRQWAYVPGEKYVVHAQLSDQSTPSPSLAIAPVAILQRNQLDIISSGI